MPGQPSDWVLRFAPRIPVGGTVLDLPCGRGRHTRLLLDRGHAVVAVDIDTSHIADLAGRVGLEVIETDLEDGRPFPLISRQFAGVVVTAYLYRPLLADIVAAVAPGGLLIYETFARGQERFGRPTSPDFQLLPGELLDAVRGQLRVMAYEDLEVETPRPAVLQRLCAVRETG
jgi:SAM-dependent methyltransferase